MYPRRRRMVRQALRLGLLVTIVVLALSACGGGEKQQESRPRPCQRNRKPCAQGNTARRSSSPPSPSGSARAGQAHHWKRPTACSSRMERRRGYRS